MQYKKGKMSNQKEKRKEVNYEFIWKSNGIGLSKLIKDVREDGKEQGITQERKSLVNFLLNKFNNCIYDIENITQNSKEIKERLLKFKKTMENIKNKNIIV